MEYKLCKDCENSDLTEDIKYSRCTAYHYVDLISGINCKSYCTVARMDGKLCGVEAKGFVSKTDEKKENI